MNHFWNPELYTKAWHFATYAHADQTYGGPEEGQRIPYINHIGSVTMEVALALAKSTGTLDGDLAIQCALLHDIIEDTPHAYEDVFHTFGVAVADGVSALTKDKTLPTKLEQMQDSLVRIKQQPQEVWMVKLADRITNLQQPPFYWDTDKARSYRNEAQVIYDELRTANAVLSERLQAKIEAYQVFLEG